MFYQDSFSWQSLSALSKAMEQNLCANFKSSDQLKIKCKVSFKKIKWLKEQENFHEPKSKIIF